jgi:hypothetical protein
MSDNERPDSIRILTLGELLRAHCNCPVSLRVNDAIDGGAQGLSTLLILNRLMETIERKLGSKKDTLLRPCDVFDVIAGVGTGG